MDVETRFWSKVKKPVDPDGCWEWTGCRLAAGYGQFRYKGKTSLAHRVAWELMCGRIPSDVFIVQICENRRCVNVKHLKIVEKKNIEQRFWEKVKKTKGCWEWAGSCMRLGYGMFRLDGLWQPAHRVAWKLVNGEIPEGLDILHKCDNRKCVNPNHLSIGTQNDNMYDMVKKGRQWKKLLDFQVAEIRKRHEEQDESVQMLANEYGVSIRLVRGIVKREFRKHVR